MSAKNFNVSINFDLPKVFVSLEELSELTAEELIVMAYDRGIVLDIDVKEV